jgi:deoxyribonucleoside regulator
MGEVVKQMSSAQKQWKTAVRAAQMYYYQNVPMKTIAAEMGVSHSTISRLLAWAREQGVVEIRIHDLRSRADSLQEAIKLHFALRSAYVVAVPEISGQQVWQEQVAQVAAAYLSQYMESKMLLGVAWGGTINLVGANLTPKSLIDAHVVQLNGGEIISNPTINHAGGLVTQFATNFDARAHLFPVPTFFDYAETKQALWRESSIQRILQLHRQADILLFSIGSFEGPSLSAVYAGDYLQEADLQELRQQGVVGDIANIMIRADGTHADVPLNARACGPDLDLFRHVDRAICVVSGFNKLAGLRGALAGGYVTDLIIDEPTAHRLVFGAD